MRASCGHLHSLSSNEACVHPSILASDDTKLLPSWTQDLLEECRTIDTRSVNPNKSTYIDSILQGLNSPAPQSLYVLQRAVHRMDEIIQQQQPCGGSSKDINASCDSIYHAFEMLQTTAFFVVKRGYRLVLLSSLFPDSANLPKSTEGTSISDEGEDRFPFQIIRVDQDISGTKWRDIPPSPTRPNILSTIQIANALLEEVTEASEDQVASLSRDDHSVVVAAADRSLEQLSWTMGMDLRGRTSADAAFGFALAGTRNEALFQVLAVVSMYELLRVGKRPSFLSRYVLQIIEKHAAAGSKGPAMEALHRTAAGCLMEKGEHLNLTKTLLGSAKDECIANNDNNATVTSSLDLLSARPLLWLWRFSARQRKAKNSSKTNFSEADPLNTGATQNNCKEYTLSQGLRPPPTLPIFPDPKRPLVVDLGCGMGTSLLGLASAAQSVKDGLTMLGINNFEDYNFLGADLSQLALGFGQGVADRWRLNNKLQFSWSTAEECLEMVEKSYEGQVALIMIQFPTPYRLASSDNQLAGNLQLPSDFQTGFMVSDSLLSQVARILSQSGGKLLVQSNCEDVAVTIRQRAIAQHGMYFANVPQEVASMDHVNHQTLRSTEWIKMGGERAIGPGWSLTPLLPELGRTETEVACVDQGTPIHRCLLSFQSQERHGINGYPAE